MMNSIVVILSALFVISSAEDSKNYTVYLPAVGGPVKTTAKVTLDDDKKTIIVEIKDVNGKSAGGRSYANFEEKVFVIQSTDRTRCNVMVFPEISYEDAKNLLKTAPTPDGKLPGVYCKIKNIQDSQVSVVVEYACGNAATTIDLSDCVTSDANVQYKVSYAIVSGFDGANGLVAVQGASAIV